MVILKDMKQKKLLPPLFLDIGDTVAFDDQDNLFYVSKNELARGSTIYRVKIYGSA